MKHQTVNLVKFKALGKLLGTPLCTTVGVLESLWIFAQIQARDGDLSRYSALEIAGWIEWPGDPDELIDALVRTKWLDREGESLLIHDWDSHKPNWLKGNEASSATKRRESPSAAPSAAPSATLSAAPSVTPSATPPNPTQPNPTINTGRPVAVRPAVVVDEEVYEGYRERLQQIHKAVDGKRGLRREDRHTAILAAVLARERLGESWLDEILGSAKLRRGELKNPWAYFKKACISSVVRRGENWDELVRGVAIRDELLNGRQPVVAGAGQEAE